MHIIQEKVSKLFRYAKLEFLFAKRNEFSNIHPELKNVWKKKFRQMIRYSSNRVFPIVEEFLTVKISKLKEYTAKDETTKAPILICVFRNDFGKLRFFMEHYRKIGIQHFVFLDNGSADGSLEFLLEQEDVTVYSCIHEFASNRKIAWINRMIAELGDNKWYLMVDSDEFVTYLGNSEHRIDELIAQCESKGYKRVGGLMLDMYATGNLFDSNSENFMEQCRYLDRDTYDFSWAANGIRITGGPRKRIFGTPMKLSKYCLFYFEEDDVIPSSHFMIPFEKGFNVPVSMAILHYKFTDEKDYEKILDAVETGKYSNNSAEYKTYFKGVKENPQLTFYDEKHSMIFSEDNLKEISFIKNVFASN
ncbi:MAG: glycosyltransferase family 2 protein [Lachnospiraceae bacterium]|nr:glycosyltransferase family 2 protein [Lachnospiraceae bacterium]